MSGTCETPGCGRARYRGDLCDACYRRALKAERAAEKGTTVVRTAVWSTGDLRWTDGRREAAYTDGRQTWWAVAMGGA